MSIDERSAFILMKRIHPVPARNVLMRAGQTHSGEALSELGIFGVFIGDGQKVLLNEFGGQLLRTKLEGVNEGGVAAGFACLDSIMFTD